MPEVNAIAREMGFIGVSFEAELGISAIEDLALPNGHSLPPGMRPPPLQLKNAAAPPVPRSKVRVKLRPDRARADIFRLLEYEDFLDLYDQIKARWEEYCFDETASPGDTALFSIEGHSSLALQSQAFTLSTEGPASSQFLVTPGFAS